LVDLTSNNGVNVTQSSRFSSARPFLHANENWNGRNTALFASDQMEVSTQVAVRAGYRIDSRWDHGSIEK